MNVAPRLQRPRKLASISRCVCAARSLDSSHHEDLNNREKFMKNITIIAIASFILAGCAAKLVSTSPRTVVISASDVFVQESQDMADKECAKHGRFARMIGKPSPTSDQFTFDCVN